MTFYGNKESCDITLITSDSLIHCHRDILRRNIYFKKYLIYNCDHDVKISNIVTNFDECIVISYIKYLYDIDEIDYDNIIVFIEFLDFVNDNIFKLKISKIPNLKEIICNLDIPDNIVKYIIKHMSFGKLLELDFGHVSEDVLNRLIEYKVGNYKTEMIYMKNVLMAETNRIQDNLIQNSTITLLCKKMLNNNFKKIIFKPENIKFFINLIDETNYIEENSYIIKHLLENQEVCKINWLDPGISKFMDHYIFYKGKIFDINNYHKFAKHGFDIYHSVYLP